MRRAAEAPRAWQFHVAALDFDYESSGRIDEDIAITFRETLLGLGVRF